MKQLVLTLKNPLPMPIDMSPITPDHLAGKTLQKIKKIRLQSGKNKLQLDTVFDIHGDSDAELITIQQSSEKLDYIGHMMGSGTIEINGASGDYLGKDMTSGKITVSGSTGLWAGTGMQNGYIKISKNAGDHLGSVLPGNKYGMQGGIIQVQGNVGTRVGECMRRGMIIIVGDVGDYCACRMYAGTILVLGQSGENIGFGMRRGSIILTKKPKTIPATFNHCGNIEFGFIRLVLKEATKISGENIFNKYQCIASRMVGDLATTGKGELLILGA